MKNITSSLLTAQYPTSKTQNVARIALGLFLLFAGISHLTFARINFRAQVPDWLPLDTDLVVVLSGVAEILLGMSLVFLKRYKILVGLIAGLFFICVFPGNISQYLGHKDAFGLDTDRARFIRLFFQPVLVAWAIWSSGAWAYLRSRK